MNKDKPRLGRGLASLLGDTTVHIDSDIPQQAEESPTGQQRETTESHKSETATRLIPISRVDPNPYQPRTQVDEQGLEKLIDSIHRYGVIQPIVVRPKEDRYQLVAGQRRLEAARALNVNAIPAVIRDVSEQELIEIALVENIHREDLNCVDRALAYKKYQDTFQLSTEDIAERLGQDRTTVTNYLRLLTLPVRQTEQIVAHSKSPKSAKKIIEKNPNILDLEQQMTRALSTKVQILPSRKKDSGKVIIEYYSLDDFDRILEHICGSQREEL